MPAEISYGMSACQQHIWEGMRFRTTGNPSHSSMNMYAAPLLIGQLDLRRLTDAVQHLTDLHDVLRMRLSDSGETPSLIVAESTRAPVAFIDMSAGDITEATRLSATIVSALAGQTFDLVARPPWCCTVIRLPADQHIICLVLNHLLVDGTSALKLFGQLGAIYSGREITPRPASYASFAGRAYPVGTGRFWAAEADYPAVAVDAPEGGSGPQTVAWRNHPVEFRDEIPILTNDALRKYHYTPYMVHSAAYCASLAQVFGRSSFVVATAVNRGDLATSTSVGCYLDIVYFLYRDAPESSVSQLVLDVRRAFLRGLQNLSLKRSIIADIKFGGDVDKVPPGTFFHDVWIGGALGSAPDRSTGAFSGLVVKGGGLWEVESSCRIIATPYEVWLYSKKLMPGLYLNTRDGKSARIRANRSAHSNDLVQRISVAYRNILLAMDHPDTSLHDAREHAQSPQ